MSKRLGLWLTLLLLLLPTLLMLTTDAMPTTGKSTKTIDKTKTTTKFVLSPLGGGSIAVATDEPNDNDEDNDDETVELLKQDDLSSGNETSTIDGLATNGTWTDDGDDDEGFDLTGSVSTRTTLVTTTPHRVFLENHSNAVDADKAIRSNDAVVLPLKKVTTTATAATTSSTMTPFRDGLTPEPCERWVVTYDYLPVESTFCRRLGNFDGLSVDDRPLVLTANSTDPPPPPQSAAADRLPPPARHAGGSVVTEDECLRACLAEPRCHAVAYSVENAPYCVLYADRSHRRGGRCDLDRQVTWKLFETTPGCVKHNDALQCGATGIEDRKLGRFVVENCGVPRIITIPPIYRSSIWECSQVCAADPRCLMIVWHSLKADNQCYMYAHNAYYDDQRASHSHAPCTLTRVRTAFTRVWEKRCTCHLTEIKKRTDECEPLAST